LIANFFLQPASGRPLKPGAFPAASSARAFDATTFLKKAPGHYVQVKRSLIFIFRKSRGYLDYSISSDKIGRIMIKLAESNFWQITLVFWAQRRTSGTWQLDKLRFSNWLVTLASGLSSMRKHLGGVWLGWVRSDGTLGTDLVVRSFYQVLGNVERIVELGGINLSKFSIPFILIHSSWSGQIDSQSQSMVKGRLTNYYG